MDRKSTIAIDFDGVIRDKVTDKPVAGSLMAIRELLNMNQIIVFTARNDLEHVANWLEDNEFPKLRIVNRKPVAKIYLDDHAVRFNGDWSWAMRDISMNEEGWQDGEEREAQRP